MIALQDDLKSVNIISPEFKANPFAFYARLRQEAPVLETKIGNKPVWLITRYEDVKNLMMDERFVKDTDNVQEANGFIEGWMPDFIKAMQNNMLDMDAPDHTRLKNLVHTAFTPRRIQQMEARIESLAETYLKEAKAKGEVDLVKDYALPIPATVIAEILGIPSSDMGKFHRWSSSIINLGDVNILNMLKMMPNMWQFVRYVRKQLELRQDHPKDDLLTALVQAEAEGDKMSMDEAVAMVILLLIAGHETTVNLIASGTYTLLENPEQLALLRQDPSLMKSAVEELLRFTVPVETGTERYAREDVTLHGVTIPQGSLTFAVIASANRDETVFENPNTLDITRSPNRHLSFGHGIHYCLGAPLARMEGSIALNKLVQDAPKLRLGLPANEITWRGGMILRGLKELPVKF